MTQTDQAELFRWEFSSGRFKRFANAMQFRSFELCSPYLHQLLFIKAVRPLKKRGVIVCGALFYYHLSYHTGAKAFEEKYAHNHLTIGHSHHEVCHCCWISPCNNFLPSKRSSSSYDWFIHLAMSVSWFGDICRRRLERFQPLPPGWQCRMWISSR